MHNNGELVKNADLIDPTARDSYASTGWRAGSCILMKTHLAAFLLQTMYQITENHWGKRTHFAGCGFASGSTRTLDKALLPGPRAPHLCNEGGWTRHFRPPHRGARSHGCLVLSEPSGLAGLRRQSADGPHQQPVSSTACSLGSYSACPVSQPGRDF